MALANAVYLDIFSFLLLGFILINSYRSIERSFVQYRLFLANTASVMVLLVLDILGRVFDGLPGQGNLILNWASNVLLFAFTPVVPCIWMLFTSHQVHHDERRLKAFLPYIAAYLLLNAAISAGSLWTGWFFFIGAGNVYHRGSYIIYYAAISYLILFGTTVYVLINRRKINRKHFLALLLFPLPPAVGSMLQNLWLGASFMASGLTLSILMIYLNLQEKRLQTDYQTGIYNRRRLDNFLEERIKNSAKGKTFSAILLDLDGFKSINDNYGHDAGDEALLGCVNLLTSCLRQSDCVARYGGDEFLIVTGICDLTVLEGTVERIRRCFERFNETHSQPYNLNFSTGYDVYDPASGMNPEQFIKHIDRLMYENKRKANC